jgi:predicted O-methyltransferase YrrM
MDSFRCLDGLVDWTAASVHFVASRSYECYISVGTEVSRLGHDKCMRSMYDGTLDIACPACETLAPWTAYHTFCPSLLRLSRSEAVELRQYCAREGGSNKMLPREWLLDRKPDYTQIACAAIRRFGAQQNQRELEQLLPIVDEWRPRVVLEIGTSRGGSLVALAQVSAPDATLITVDIPLPERYSTVMARHDEMVVSLGRMAQTVTVVREYSETTAALRAVEALLPVEGVDLLYIDGDHSYEGVRNDYERFRQLLSPRGHAVFHDICVAPDRWPGARTLKGRPPDVKRFWTEIRRRSSIEIIDLLAPRPATSQPRTVSWGIGIL